MAAQVSQLTGTVRDLVRQRRTLATKGNRLRNLFVAALQNSFGPESQRMNEFGVRPRAFRRKKAENGPNSGTPSTEPATNPDGRATRGQGEGRRDHDLATRDQGEGRHDHGRARLDPGLAMRGQG